MESLGVEIGWPLKKPREKQTRVHNHHVSMRDRVKELQSRAPGRHARLGDGGREETTKAVAWAVFQHHGEGGVGTGHTHGMAVRRPTRFKIEAQMKQGVAHRSVYEAVASQWDAGSTLFDSFELSSLLRTLDEAAHAKQQQQQQGRADGEEAEEAQAMVVYAPPSPTHRTTRRDAQAPSERQSSDETQRAVRYSLTGHVKDGRHDARDDLSSALWHAPESLARRSFDSSHSEEPARVGPHHHHHHHHNRWRSLLHTLHLDGTHGLFHGFHKSHTQVAPHDLEQKGRRDGDDSHLERNDLSVSKDVEKDDHHHHHHHHRHLPHFWKLGFITQPFCRAGHLLSDNEGSEWEAQSPHRSHKRHHGHRHADLRAAWSSLRANLLHHHHHHHKHSPQGEQPSQTVITHHHHHHHHHHHGAPSEGDDHELTVQAISMRLARPSFEEKARRLSSDDGGLKAPRNSLETAVRS